MSAARPPVYDDRYTAPVEASRRGAHRARPNPLTAVLPVVAGIVVVALVIGGTFALLRPSGQDSGGNVAAAPTADVPTGGAQPTGAPDGTPSAGDSGADSGDEPSGGPTSRATVDKDSPIRVLNSVSVAGLAKRHARTLEGAGWTVGETGNSSQRNLTTTRVYYATTADAATAKAIVKALGFGEAVRSTAGARGGTTVVLGRDAR